MHGGLRSLSGRDQYNARKRALRPVPGDPYGKLADLAHGQNNDSGERGNLRGDSGSGHYISRGEPTKGKEASYPAQHRSDENGRTDSGTSGKLLLELRTYA